MSDMSGWHKTRSHYMVKDEYLPPGSVVLLGHEDALLAKQHGTASPCEAPDGAEAVAADAPDAEPALEAAELELAPDAAPAEAAAEEAPKPADATMTRAERKAARRATFS